MASTNVARFLIKQFLDSLDNEEKSSSSSSSSDPVLDRFKALSKKLKDNIYSAAVTNPESISKLYDLNDALTEWRILKDQKKSFKGILPCLDVSHITNDHQSPIDQLGRMIEASSSSKESRQPNMPLWDRYTFYKPDPITCIKEDQVCVEHETKIINWLLTSSDDEFKAIGIYGMGGSGKTALVKKVLSQKSVGEKFKRIIWACLSQLTCEEEIDVRLMEYLLYHLGLDIDSLLSDDKNNKDNDSLMKDNNVDEYKNWLVKQVEDRLLNSSSGNYILVLDDMWLYGSWFAEEFLGRLKKNGGGGGAVVVTSRRKTVAEKIGYENRIVHLNHPCS